MDFPLEIDHRNVQHSQAADRLIQAEAEKLARLCPRIAACHVVLASRRMRQGDDFTVHVNVDVAGQLMSFGRRHDSQPQQDLYAAIREVFAAVGRRLAELSDEAADQRTPPPQAHS